MQWFMERDFDEVGLSDLPPERQKLYNPQRNSKIYSKVLQTERPFRVKRSCISMCSYLPTYLAPTYLPSTYLPT